MCVLATICRESIEMEINNLPYKSDGKDSSKRLTTQLGERFTVIDRRKFMRWNWEEKDCQTSLKISRSFETI